MRRYLVVANQTLGGDELVGLMVKRAKCEVSEFFLVVPATPVVDYAPVGAVPMMGGLPVIPESPESARALAQERLQTALAQLRELGVVVDGRVGEPDPVQAVATVGKGRQFDEIIVSTLSNRLSRWLGQDLPRRLERKSGLPVTHVERHSSTAP